MCLSLHGDFAPISATELPNRKMEIWLEKQEKGTRPSIGVSKYKNKGIEMTKLNHGLR